MGKRERERYVERERSGQIQTEIVMLCYAMPFVRERESELEVEREK